MKLKDLSQLKGKTIQEVEWEPWGAGDEDATEVALVFTDGTVANFEASSYCIPEEPSIIWDLAG